MLQSHHEISKCSDEVYLYWQIWNHWWSQVGKIVVNLTCRLNKCEVISPRFNVQLKDLEQCQLTSCQFGFLVLTSSPGTMDHEEARRKHTGEKNLWIFFSRKVMHTNKMPQRAKKKKSLTKLDSRVSLPSGGNHPLVNPRLTRFQRSHSFKNNYFLYVTLYMALIISSFMITKCIFRYKEIMSLVNCFSFLRQ